MTFWQLVFIVKITADRLSFQRVLTSSICLQIQLGAVAEARLTPAGQRHWYIHTNSEILSKLSRRAACCAHRNTTLLFLFSSKRLFLEWRWWWHQKLQTSQDRGTAGYLHAAELIPITQLLPNGTGSLNWRAAAFLQWSHLHLLPRCSQFERVCFPWASNTGPSTTTWQSGAAMPCPFHSFFRNRGSLHYRKGLMLSCVHRRYSLQWRALFDTCRKLPFLHLIFH